MTLLQDFRKTYPQYDDVSDADLAQALHAEYAPGRDLTDFYKDLGYEPKPTIGARIASAMRAVPDVLDALPNMAPPLGAASSLIDKAVTPSVAPIDAAKNADSGPELVPWSPSLLERAQQLFAGSPERASNELAVREMAQERNTTPEQVYQEAGGTRPLLNPEGRPPIQAATEAGAVIAKQVPNLLTEAANSVLRAIRGGDDDPFTNGALDRLIAGTNTQQMGFQDPNYQAFNSLGQSLGYSLMTLAATAVSSALGTLAGGPIAGGSAGFSAAGTVAYRATKDQYLDQMFQHANDVNQTLYGKPIDPATWDKVKGNYERLASIAGGWEAIPEAASDLVMLGAFTAPLKGMARDRILQVAKRAAASLSTELSTETMTQVGQNRVEAEAGLSPPETLAQAFRDVAIPVIANVALLGGGTAVAHKAYEGLRPNAVALNRFGEALNQEVDAAQFVAPADQVARTMLSPENAQHMIEQMGAVSTVDDAIEVAARAIGQHVPAGAQIAPNALGQLEGGPPMGATPAQAEPGLSASFPIEAPPPAFLPPENAPSDTARMAEAPAKPESDLFGLGQADSHGTTQPVTMANVADLKLSGDVPQFKEGSDASGVVEPLSGAWDPRGVGLQVWQRRDGTLEVISGRHRLDLLKRQGVEQVPVQIYREADGFTQQQAAMLDAELNIRDGQGTVKDYVQYFKHAEVTPQEAESRGLLARAKGQRAFVIATEGTEALIAAHRADQITDDGAAAVAEAAPRNERLQAVGIKALQERKGTATAVNMIEAVKSLSGSAESPDLFSFDESAMKQAAAMARVAATEQRKISEQIAAVQGAAKRPEQAAQLGVDVKDPQGVLNKLKELKAERARWDSWSTSPDLVERIRSQINVNAPRETSAQAREGFPVERDEVQAAADQAATSPNNDLSEPTEAQKTAGNYQKGHVAWNGLDISIENPAGSVRSGTDEDGKAWSHTMQSHYGYIKRTEGADGDHVDVFLNPDSDRADTAFVIDQLKGGKKGGGFDEHKVMIGYQDQAAAIEAYRENYDKGWQVGDVTPMTIDQFKTWLAKGDTTKKASAQEVNSNEPGPTGGAARAQDRQTTTISDVGEKIGGARKDTARPVGARGERPAQPETGQGWRNRYVALQVLPGRENAGKWRLGDKRKKGRFGGVHTFPQVFDTEEKALAAVPLMEVARNHRVVPAGKDAAGNEQYKIIRDVTDRKRVQVVDQLFPSRDDAMRYVAAHATDIIETKTGFGEEILPKPDTVRRTGETRRTGNVKGEDFANAFGLRGVEFGNWENQEDRQQVMNHAYDSLMDLADLMDVPPRAIGLNGDLALAFGARGQGLTGARAHYEPAYAVINLTKMSGAGSIAHEWFHALDHYFGRVDTKASSEKELNDRGDQVYSGDLSPSRINASYGFSADQSRARPEVQAAYDALIETMFRKAKTYVEDTHKADEFVGHTRNDLERSLASIRRDLASQRDPQYWKRNNKPASAEQLAEFDTIAEKLIGGELLDTEVRPVSDKKTRSRYALASVRWTNDALDQISAIYKAVRGRSGFGSGNQRGILDNLRDDMKRYSARLKMLAEAQQGAEKVKQVPTDFAMEAKSIDQGRASEYWTTPHEMAARAFQSWVEDRLADRGNVNDFLTFGTNLAVETPWGWKRPYPHGEERKAINKAFDDLIGALKTQTSEKGVALYSQGRQQFALEGETPTDLRQAEAERKQSEKGAAKRKAEPGSGEFVLTGSDRETDQAAARGQQSLFSGGKQYIAMTKGGPVLLEGFPSATLARQAIRGEHAIESIREPVPLDQIRLNETWDVDGERYVVSRDAQTELQRMDSRIDAARRLLECLGL